MTCPSCGTENREGRKFCSECGTALASACPSCGAANEPGEKFCGECGAVLTASAEPSAPSRPTAPAAERRLVTVLFADLVGFTTLSESRDPEEVRELLSRYFDTSRRLIELYGGTVEKFIGDAVMAVWGTPIATEDDAERAVRAALDLVAAVSALGDEVGAPELRARAGVLTGEAAVTIGAEGQGMVAGDLVNTASRVQSAADPGTVYVGESTRRSTEQTIVYAEAGSFELKGKEGLTPLWKAQRVVSGLRGSLKSQGLEAPFVGRDRELRQIKDLFHGCADEKKAHLVSVTGIAGIGKSRLAWEFYKYFDGIAETVYWHRGRCLSYGEGVTYWALADMVRMRCRIAEEEDPASAQAKLHVTLEEHILDREERDFLEPRLAHLLGLAEHQARDQQDLFAAWRLFFERLAESYPTVLAFEDMQWADASLLDFVEYLLDWSRSHPIFVVTLARPELLERRPTWGAGQRSFTSLYLEPLSQQAMEELLTGLVPGLPSEVRDRILARAEGIPLYAVETVRMLIDRGLLVQDGPAYRVTGPVEALEVPETLHALIAARLDGLSAEERRLLQDAAVLGKTFTRDALAALAGSDAEIEPLLTALARKEVLGVQADPRSPEHGQYGFLQDLVRHVAYETLSKRERRSRHLAAAEYLRSSVRRGRGRGGRGHRIALPRRPRGRPRRGRRRRDQRARRRRCSCGPASAPSRSPRPQRRGATSSRRRISPTIRRREPHFSTRQARWPARAGDPDSARRLFEESIELHEEQGDTHAAARSLWRLARIDAFAGRRDEAIGTAGACLCRHLGRRAGRGSRPAGGAACRSATGTAAISSARPSGPSSRWTSPKRMRTRRLSRSRCGPRRVSPISRGHAEEAGALLKQSLQIALDADLVEQASICYFWLSDRCFQRDTVRRCARIPRRGARPHPPARGSTRRMVSAGRANVPPLHAWPVGRVARGERGVHADADRRRRHRAEPPPIGRRDLRPARRAGRAHAASTPCSLNSRSQATSKSALVFSGRVRYCAGPMDDFAKRLPTARTTIAVARTLGISAQAVKQGVVEALEAAFALGESAKVEELLALVEGVPIGTRPPYLDAQARRFRARLDGDPSGYAAAAEQFRNLSLPFWLAVTLLEHGELTGDESSLAEAREIFERLEARPWLERLEAAAPSRAEVPA